ncbi:MAG: fasciclin domain-containing protein [Leptolyngbya sp.]|nr:fasciclin domain-containing protein [Candidatus Melainabacteria bacterium]
MSGIQKLPRYAKTLTLATLAAVLFMPLDAAAANRHNLPKSRVIANNIILTAQRDGNFRILLSALRDTGLAAVLENTSGPYTLFAPTDAAFSKLPKNVFQKLFDDKKQLKSVLLNHVVKRRIDLSAIKHDSLRALSGEYLMTNVTSSGFATVDGAIVQKADIKCSNGIIHAIDDVLFPRSGLENIAQSNASSTYIR